jgi:hypothetical protein
MSDSDYDSFDSNGIDGTDSSKAKLRAYIQSLVLKPEKSKVDKRILR